MNKVNRIIYCIIDDLRASHFFDFVERGLLPNFKVLIDNGIFSKNCITDFPSVTYPTQPTLITGTYTGDYTKELCHGIPSYSWMGRYYAPPILRSYGGAGSDELIQVYKLNSDLGNNCQTIFEMIDEGNKTSMTQFISRGTDYIFPETKIKLAFYYELLMASRNHKKMMTRMNTIIVHKLLDNFKNPSKYFESNEPPIATHLWFSACDAIMHFYGFDSQIYKVNLLHMDKCMGMLLKGLEDMGYLDDTAIAITSDHGNYKAKKIANIDPFYQKYSLKPYHPRKNKKGNINVAEFGCVGLLYFKGNGQARDKRGWLIPSLEELKDYGPKHSNLTEDLFKVPSTVLLYHRGENNSISKGEIYVRRKEPESGKISDSLIEYQGTSQGMKTRFSAEQEDFDAFFYYQDDKASKLMDGKFHTIDEWIEATSHIDYPLYPQLVPRHMKNPRSSDIIISTAGNAIFNIEHGKVKNDHVYSHDIGLRNSAIVPLIITGSPDIPQGEIPYCKTTDIVPSLLKLLGKKPHKSVIGNSIL
ncbi:MAG: alkaline phosphatase family protein [Promethearchaeota archaeon]